MLERSVNTVYYKSSTDMCEVASRSVDLVITSPPYFNIKDYSLDGYQQAAHSQAKDGDIGRCASFDEYIGKMLAVWRECERVLAPNGKLCVNVPLMPMLKKGL